VGLNLDSVKEVHARIPECPIVLWSDALPLDCVFKTLELGVRGIVKRTIESETLASTLQKVASGEMQIGFGPSHKAAQLKRQVALTPRERELVGRLKNGLRNKQIAAEMNITEGTVKIYLFRLFHKLGVRTRFELARIAASDQLQFRQDSAGVTAEPLV
jgi:DNA-binding NarL/FixJ family response regulator